MFNQYSQRPEPEQSEESALHEEQRDAAVDRLPRRLSAESGAENRVHGFGIPVLFDDVTEM